MFERFTERARQVVVLAQEEARDLKHGYIGTEHLLLGLLREEQGLAARILDDRDVTVERTRGQVVLMVGVGDTKTNGQIPFTDRGKRVLELALREALSLGHNYIGTEHILLALAREGEGAGTRVLHDVLGKDWQEIVRGDVLGLLSGPRLREPLPQEVTYDMIRSGLGKLTVRHRTKPEFRGILKTYDWDLDRGTVLYTQPIMRGIVAEWSAQRRDLCVCDPAEVRGWEVVRKPE